MNSIKEPEFFTFSKEDIKEYKKYYAHLTLDYYHKESKQNKESKQSNNFKKYLRLLKSKIKKIIKN